jgi:methylase of polypeptide subunit release factors
MSLYDARPYKDLLERHSNLKYPYTCEFGGARLRIVEGVFCPTLTNTSPLLLENIDFRPGERVLDLFSGSGVFGIIAALAGSVVTTVDKSPIAVQCAKENAALNGVAHRVDLRIGDLASIGDGTGLDDGMEFDLVIINPPLLPGEPIDPLSAALMDPDLGATTSVIARLPKLLAPQGRSYLLTSDVLDRAGMRVEELCAEQGLSATIQDTKDCGYEQYRVHKIINSRN